MEKMKINKKICRVCKYYRQGKNKVTFADKLNDNIESTTEYCALFHSIYAWNTLNGLSKEEEIPKECIMKLEHIVL